MFIEILKYLNNQCNQFALNNVLNKIIFEFEYYEIIIDFETEKTISDNENYYTELSDQLINILSAVKVSNISIVSTEIVENRVDIGEYEVPVSKSYSLFKLLDLLNSNEINYSNYKIVEDYQYYLEDPMCPSNRFYGFQIFIDEESWDDLRYYQRMIDTIEIDIVNPPKFYWFFYKNIERNYKQRSIPYFSTNTKARRLGYLKILNKFLIEYKEIPSTKFSLKFEQFCIPYGDLLNNYINDKGRINLTKIGNSAKPYVEIAKSLALISEQGRLISLGKDFKVYDVFKNKNEMFEDSNPFYLNEFDKCYFLEILLRKDFLFFSLILEFLYIQKEISFIQFSNNFYSFLIYRIKNLSETYKSSFFSSRVFVNGLRLFEKRINNWDEPTVYLEHLLMSRLNWYLDLNLVGFSTTKEDKSISYRLTNYGLKLFENIQYWVDINRGRIIDPTEFINRFYIHVFDNVYKDSVKSENDIDNVTSLISKYLKESFFFFKTLAPNRVTSSQAISYTKYMLYFQNRIKVGHTFIENKLNDNSLSEFIYKFQGQFGDGYIQLKK